MALLGQKRSDHGPQPSPKRRKGSAPPCGAAASLPVRQVEADLISLLERQQVTVLVAETGSGKTTQVQGAPC